MGLIENLAYSHRHMRAFTYDLMAQKWAYSHSKEGALVPIQPFFGPKYPCFLQRGFKKKHCLHWRFHSRSLTNPSSTSRRFAAHHWKLRPSLTGADHLLHLAVTSCSTGDISPKWRLFFSVHLSPTRPCVTETSMPLTKPSTPLHHRDHLSTIPS